MVISSILAKLASQFKSLVHKMLVSWEHYIGNMQNNGAVFLVLRFFGPSTLALVAACT
jgi:hypothetical protein